MALQCSSVDGQSATNTEAVCRRDGAVDGQEGGAESVSAVSVHGRPSTGRRQSVPQLQPPSAVHSGNYSTDSSQPLHTGHSVVVAIYTLN